MGLEKGINKVLAFGCLREVTRQWLQEGRGASVSPEGRRHLGLGLWGPPHPTPPGGLQDPGRGTWEARGGGHPGTLTNPSMHWDSCTAPQQPRKPTSIMSAPAPIRI